MTSASCIPRKSPESDAFGAVDFEWTRQLKSVWLDPSYHVQGIHENAVTTILSEFQERRRKLEDGQLGRIVVGTAGSGKTHLVGTLRQESWTQGGWFVLLEFAGIKDFWTSAALCFVTSLNQKMPNGQTQYQALLSRIAATDGFEPRIAPLLAQLIKREDIALQIERETVLGFIQAFLVALDRVYPDVIPTPPYSDVVRACLLLVLGDWDARNIAYAWLQGLDLYDEDKRTFGFGRNQPPAIDLIRAMSWFLSLAGSTLIAVDQIDSIISEAHLRGSASSDKERGESTAFSIIESLAGGLLALHDLKHRAMIVVACLDKSWEILDHQSPALRGRFHSPLALPMLQHEVAARALVEARLAEGYAAAHFTPPYPSWPFTREAFATAVGFSPRQLLKACDDHREQCIARGEVFELGSFSKAIPTPPPPRRDGELDALFEAEKRKVDVAKFLESDAEDKSLREVIVRVLDLYAAQTRLPDDVDLAVNGDTGRQPRLHGRLTFTYHEEGDRERHYCFRALSHTNAIAFQSRLKAAVTASGIDRNLPFRHLFILRRDGPPSGPKTMQLVKEFEAAGGRFIPPTEDDLRTIIALHGLREGKHEGFSAWLQARKPLCDTTLFHAAGLCGESDLATAEGEAGSTVEPRIVEPEPPPVPQPAPSTPSSESVIPVGRRIEAGGLGRAGDGIESIDAKFLPKHTAILAGSGSGKTVLLRRIVEEAALLKIPAIVLDTNNDLVLLGEAWPRRPAAFSDEDQSKADAYASNVEVVVWTPGVSGGRPLRLALLPDFSALGDRPDEREQAVHMALATLKPLLGSNTTTGTGRLRAGVLAGALADFARRGGKSLDDLVHYLHDLPEGVTGIKDAERHANAVADQLIAAIALDPLLAAPGIPLDPRELFGDEAGGKTRISVINLSGLLADETKQSFVNRLQMALFTFIKKEPSARGRLYVLDEAQNFAPAQKSTPCKESTLSLVAQARKYGLGMIFATQAPKGIDNKIVSNCSTHFYGKMNSPVTIEAVKELVAAKGGHADDIASLGTGVFYFATEGSPRPVKLRTPLCLSHHPPNPLGSDEVIARTKG